jgi:serine/threonine-protein kinase HipA
MPDGRWGRPVDGTPSTHILKPEIDRFPNTVENEAFCMGLAQNLGLETPMVETTTIGGRRLIVVERYDRIVQPNGSVERVHQEDFCQATGILPVKKYEEDGGPSLRRVAETLQATTASDSLETLLRAVTLNVVIANGDAHGKNFSLLHDPSSGALRLAPLYDLVSTLVYGDDRLAMYVDDVHRSNKVTAERIVNEAAAWGLARPRAVEIIDDLLDRIPDAVEAAREETEGLPPEIPKVITVQLRQLREAAGGAGNVSTVTVS